MLRPTIGCTCLLILLFISVSLKVSGSTKKNKYTFREKPWLRLPEIPGKIRISPQNTHLAFIRKKDLNLMILDIHTKKIFSTVNDEVNKDGFIWMNHGHRLLIKQSYSSNKINPVTNILTFDVSSKKTVEISRTNSFSGHLSYDRIRNRIHYLHSGGVRTVQLYYPKTRLSLWQRFNSKNQGTWIVTKHKIYWRYVGAQKLRTIKKSSSQIISFDISKNGRHLAWETSSNKIFISTDGSPAKYITLGKFPKWHPETPLLVMACSRMLGNITAGSDLCLSDLNGNTNWLTSSTHKTEKWPQWLKNGQQIIYSKKNSTDLFVLNL